MHSFTSPKELKQWDRFGPTGLSQWKDSVEKYYVASKAGIIHSPTSILTLQPLHNWIKSKTDTTPMNYWRCCHQKMQTLESLLLMNVSLKLKFCLYSLKYLIKDPTSVLCFPRLTSATIPEGTISKIIASLVTRYDTTRTIIKRHFRAQELEIWGKFRRLEGGDTMRAAAVCRAEAEDRRDASYVRVCGLLIIKVSH